MPQSHGTPLDQHKSQMTKELPMSKTYRIGVIGLGHMGQRYLDVLCNSKLKIHSS
jgi:hypothetical protein